MKDKILQEVLEWYEGRDEKPDVPVEDFVDLIINKTADAIFDELKNELQNEFTNGNLKHPFIISSDYYLDLKLKEIKFKCVKNTDSNRSSEK